MSAFSCERAAASVLELRALSSACLVSCWSVVFGSRHSCFEFRSRDGVRTLALHFLSLCDCAVSSSLGTAHSCPCVFCCTQFVFLSAACIYVISCAVWHAAYIFIGCVLSCCHVLCEHVAYEFSHYACSCPVLHMAGDLFAGHVLVFLFCVSMWLLS